MRNIVYYCLLATVLSGCAETGGGVKPNPSSTDGATAIALAYYEQRRIEVPLIAGLAEKSPEISLLAVQGMVSGMPEGIVPVLRDLPPLPPLLGSETGEQKASDCLKGVRPDEDFELKDPTICSLMDDDARRIFHCPD